MRLKVFRLKNSKLEYAGIREVQQGDVILEGSASMAEVASEISLRESTGGVLEDAVRKLHPEYTEQQIQTFLKGR